MLLVTTSRRRKGRRRLDFASTALAFGEAWKRAVCKHVRLGAKELH